jgi:putative SOS response-associated peptidase YedK
MCGRYRLSRSKELLAERFDVEPDDDWEPRYNIAPTQNIPVIRQHPEQPKRLVVV